MSMAAKKGAKRRRRKMWSSHRPPMYAPPGTLVVDPTAAKPTIRVISYGPDHYLDRSVTDPGDLLPLLHQHSVTWVNVDGLGDLETIKRLGEIFGLHKLAQEDVLNVGQRPKVDEYDTYLFIVARMLDRPHDHHGDPRNDHRLGTEQLSMFVGKDFVLTFQEWPGDCLDAIRMRAKEKRGRVRDAGADYLAYAILDAVIDEYFPVIESYGDLLEQLEDEALVRPRPGTGTRVHKIKRDLLVLRRAMWPLREAVNVLQRGTSSLITAETRLYVRDAYDHCVQILDLVEIYRELCTGLLEMYMTSISHRLNEVMRLLTIISTIFIPLTFIAGVYGMNFKNQPEFNTRFGYPIVLLVMAAIGITMMVFFYRKGWLGRQENALDIDEGDEQESPKDEPLRGNGHPAR